MRKNIILLTCLMMIIGVIFIVWILIPTSPRTSKSQTPSTLEKSPSQPEETKKMPILQGKITKIHQQTITIEQYPDKPVEGAKGYVTIHKQTKIYLKQREEWKPIEKDEIKQGLKASAWYDGAITMIYPMRFSADVLVIEEE